jgi:GAF domain-containing protein
MAKRPKTARQATKKRKASAPRKRSADVGVRKETTRLKRELAEALERQKATGEILAAISNSTAEVQPILDTIVRTASRLCEAEYALIYKLRNGEYHLAAANNATTTFVKYAVEHPLVPGRSTLIGRTALEQKTVHLPDCLADPEYKAFDYQRAGEYRSMLGVPLQQGGAPVGVIALFRAVVKPFTDRQIELVTSFANQAVIAIENARLFDEVKARTLELSESLEQQTATSEVLSVISNLAGELEPVFDKMLENATRVCGANFGTMNLVEDGVITRVAAYNVPSAYADAPDTRSFRPHPKSSLGQVIATKTPHQVLDLLTSPAYLEGNPAVASIVHNAGARSLATVPMLRDTELIGTISVYGQEVRPFSGKQIELLSNFAAQAVIAIENTRLLKELRKRTDDLTESLQQQTATADVLKVISRSTLGSKPNLESVLETLLESAIRLCGATRGQIFRYDGKIMQFVAASGASPGFREWLRTNPFVPSKNSAAGRASLDRKICHIPDVMADPNYGLLELVKQQRYRSALGVPMLKDGKLLGVIAILKSKVEPFTEKQIELVSTFADQAVIAFENVRLFDEVQARTEDLRESLQQQTATSDVLKVISRSTFDLKTVLDTLVQSAARLSEADYSFIFRRDGEEYRLAASHGFSSEYRDWMEQQLITTGRQTLVGRTALEGSTIHIPDVLADPEYGWSESIKRGGFRAMLGIPLMREGVPIGVIAVCRSTARPFTAKQVELVTTFADQAVIAIENVRLFDEVQARTEDLRESLQQQTATADVLKVISRSTFDLQTVLHTLVESAARLCDADKATITRQRDGAFYRAESFGFSREFMDHVRDIPVAADRGSATGRALLEGVVVHIPDVQADPDYHFNEALRLGNYRTLLGVPMLREGTPIGVVTLTRSEPRPFTAKQIELVATFADQAAIAIENVRLFESVEARTKELAASLEGLRAAQDRLIQTEKLASLGQLTAGIAHEIKNPLNFVNNFSALSVELVDELGEVLKPAPLDDKTRQETDELAQMLKGNLEKVVQHGKRADSIVKNMLMHSREGSGERRPVDINSLVGESLNLAYHGARAEKQGFQIRLDQDFDPAAGEAELLPQEITRVLLNLISNGFYAAMKRKAENGGNGYEPMLAATTRDMGDRVEIRIRDNGSGIPPEVKEKMFNPFFTTKPPGEGTGLGLSLSYDIVVKQHSGSIEVDTRPGEFTEFRVVLPRTAAAAVNSPARPSTQMPRPQYPHHR